MDDSGTGPGARPGIGLLVAVLALGAATACKNEIGDECVTSIDCSQETERVCDISQPGGYCTIDGCDERSCPEEAACVRFFPRTFLERPCAPGNTPSDCTSEEICLPEGTAGVCAPRASERRYCVKTCAGGDDCRSRYECRPTGTQGSIALTSKPGAVVRFCAPKAVATPPAAP